MAVDPQPTAQTYLQLEALVNATAAKDVTSAAGILREAIVGDLEQVVKLLAAAVSALASVCSSTVPCALDSDGHELMAEVVMAQLTDISLRRLLAIETSD